MSLPEVSNTIDLLAKKITEKSVELERLKRQYEQKLSVLNSYISSFESVLEDGELSKEELMQIIEKDVSCESCGSKVWSLDDSKYLLIPKKSMAQVIIPQKEIAVPPKIPHMYNRSKSSSSSTGNSKKICSYCNYSGHSRAKCPIRLNNG